MSIPTVEAKNGSKCKKIVSKFTALRHNDAHNHPCECENQNS